MGLGEAIKKSFFAEEETEEEKKKRLAREAAANASGNPYTARKARIDKIIADAEK